MEVLPREMGRKQGSRTGKGRKSSKGEISGKFQPSGLRMILMALEKMTLDSYLHSAGGAETQLLPTSLDSKLLLPTLSPGPGSSNSQPSVQVALK